MRNLIRPGCLIFLGQCSFRHSDTHFRFVLSDFYSQFRRFVSKRALVSALLFASPHEHNRQENASCGSLRSRT